MKKSDKIGRKFLLKSAGYYFSILLLPVIIGYTTYYGGVANVRSNIYSVHNAMLAQGMSAVEYNLRIMEKMASQIVANSVLVKQSYSTTTGPAKAFEITKCINELKTYMVGGDNLENSYIYYHNNSAIVNSSTMYNASLFYERVLMYDTNKFDQWKTALQSKLSPKDIFHTEEYSKDGNQPYITFALSLPMDVVQEPRATFVTHLRKSYLADIFKNSNSAKYAILNSAGNIILSSSGEMFDAKNLQQLVKRENAHEAVHLDGQKMLCVSQISQYNNWAYIYFLPEKVVFADLNKFRDIFLAVFFVVMLIGFAALLALLYRSNKPAYEIYRNLQITFDGEVSFNHKANAYTIIEQSINQLVRSNDTLMKSLREQAPVLKTAFTANLLRGVIHSEEEVRVQMEYLGVLPKYPNGYFHVALMRISAKEIDNAQDMAEISFARKCLSKFADECLDNVFLTHNLDYATLAIVFNVPFIDKNVTRNGFHELSTLSEKATWHIPYCVGIGETYKQLSEIWNSFSQANLCLNASLSTKKSLLFYEDVRQHSDEPYYSQEVQQHLADALQLGDDVTSLQILQMLEYENFQRRSLAPFTAQTLFADIRATFAECGSSLKDTELTRMIELISFTDNASQSFKMLNQTCKYVCAVFKNRYNKENHLATQMKAYIDEIYMLPQINLATAATHFHFSEGYFSTLFKETVGQPFTEYLEGVRIYKAAVLLKETDLTIEKVASLCGYNSVQSFRRAFKRVTDMHPSGLRN